MDEDKRLVWLLRRGMKELDVMVTRYHVHRYSQAPTQEREAFVRMLETAEDPDIWSWTMGYASTPAEYDDVVQQLRIHR